MKLTMKHSVLALSLLSAFGVAQATALTTGVVTPNVDTVAGSFGGTLLAQASTAISNISYNGTARTAVYDTGTGLDFYYQYSNNTSAVNGVDRFTGYDFSSLGASVMSVFQTSAAFDMFTAGTVASTNADRSLLGVIGFTFVPGDSYSKIEPGTTSFTQIVRTNARTFQAGNFGLLDGIGDNAQGFAPSVTAVPETETLAMMFVGLGLMGTIIRRRNKAQQPSDKFVA
jgi:hypothetical protein